MTEAMEHVPHPGSRTDMTARAAEAEASTADPWAMEAQSKFSVSVTQRAAFFGSYSTVVFQGTEGVTAALPYDELRARAYLICSGTGPVYVGRKDALNLVRANGLPSSGIVLGVSVLASGVVLPVMHQEAVHIIPDGTHSATVTIVAERWSSDMP
jgi:hypothetical protein